MLVFLFGLFHFPYLNSCDKHDFFFLMKLFTYLGGGSRGVYITITYFANCDQIRIKIHNFQKLGLLLFCLFSEPNKKCKNNQDGIEQENGQDFLHLLYCSLNYRNSLCDAPCTMCDYPFEINVWFAGSSLRSWQTARTCPATSAPAFVVAFNTNFGIFWRIQTHH